MKRTLFAVATSLVLLTSAAPADARMPVTTYRYKNCNIYQSGAQAEVCVAGTIIPDGDGTGGLLQNLRIYADGNQGPCDTFFESSPAAVNYLVQVVGAKLSGGDQGTVMEWLTPDLGASNNCTHTYDDVHVNKARIIVRFSYKERRDNGPDNDNQMVGFSGDTSDYVWSCNYIGPNPYVCSRVVT